MVALETLNIVMIPIQITLQTQQENMLWESDRSLNSSSQMPHKSN